MIDLLTLRGLFFIEGCAALLFYAWIFGRAIANRGLSYIFTGTGFGGILVYVTAIQVKAQKRNAPFDGYSWVGLTAITVLLIGFLLYLGRRRDVVGS